MLTRRLASSCVICSCTSRAASHLKGVLGWQGRGRAGELRSGEARGWAELAFGRRAARAARAAARLACSPPRASRPCARRSRPAPAGWRARPPRPPPAAGRATRRSRPARRRARAARAVAASARGGMGGQHRGERPSQRRGRLRKTRTSTKREGAIGERAHLCVDDPDERGAAGEDGDPLCGLLGEIAQRRRREVPDLEAEECRVADVCAEERGADGGGAAGEVRPVLPPRRARAWTRGDRLWRAHLS